MCVLCVGMCVVAIKDASCPCLSACSFETGRQGPSLNVDHG